MRGATLISAGLFVYSQRFNPRAHAGRDSIWINCDVMFFVSIHAPMRGATIV